MLNQLAHRGEDAALRTDVRLNGDRVPALLLDIANHTLRRVAAMLIVNADSVPAFGGELRSGSADQYR